MFKFILNLINSNLSAFGISGFDQAEILRGRPYGGCAIFWKQNLNVTVSFIDSSSRRVCAIRCNFDFGSLLLINVYMPYEKDDASYDDFRLQLSVIDDIIERNADCHVILGGDFNVDFGRERLHTNLLVDFCKDNNLNPTVSHSVNMIDYSYNFCMKRFQIVDHFILSEQLFKESVTRVDVCHDIENTSDHDPIGLELLLNVKHFSTCTRQFTAKVIVFFASASCLFLPNRTKKCFKVLLSNEFD